MSNYKHGHGKATEQSGTYRSWAAMKRRCDNPNVDNYRFYGALGITYDPAWASFETFLKDMGERPEGTTLDRIEGDLNYTKNNCRWATKKEQSENSASTKLTQQKADDIRASFCLKSPQESTRAWSRRTSVDYGVSPETIRAIVQGRLWRSDAS